MTFARGKYLILILLLASGQAAQAGVLPDDRTDFLYHRFEGGGVLIDGPSVLVRKKLGKSLSFVGNYYVDSVSSASIDVVTQASPYTEERTQKSIGMDYLRGNTIMSLGYVTSVESDFDATTYSFSVSQDMFGDLTTLTLSYAFGDDIVGRVDDPTFEENNTRQHYGIGITQIFTRNLITTFKVETITEEGFLNNPYRSVRYLDSGSPVGYSYQPELYPSTRTSTAIGARARYFLPYRAAIQGEYRFFTDTWDIISNTVAISYTHPWHDFTFEAKYRWHDQSGAHFFNDLFPRADATNFRGRDKELSPLTSETFRISGTYEFMQDGWNFLDRGSVTASVDLLSIDYKEFRDVRYPDPPGTEPLYHLDAYVFQLYFSFWY